ncbi:MAG: N-acetylmuramate alpha-1-phosphate uridylyltransferase MurU [Burkholderiaceae bacterium]
MKALILAAGRGERMRPLTDTCPKPLLRVHGKPLIEWHIEALSRAGVNEIVINTAWLEDRIAGALGDGSRFGVRIAWSMEGRDHGGALETAGGIAKALPLLAEGAGDGDKPFWLVSADIFAPDFAFDPAAAARFEATSDSAHLWLVPNPDFHAKGDFGLDPNGRGLADPAGPDGRTWTYANLALMRPTLVRHIASGTRAALGPLLYAGMRQGRIGAEVFNGEWHNLGTPAQLDALNRSTAL